MENKKAQLNTIVPAVLSLTLAAILLIFGLLILDALYNDTDNAVGIVANETLTTVTASGEVVSAINSCLFSKFAVTSAVNATGGELIAAGNYTVNAATGTVYSATSGHYNNTNWKVTGTFAYGGVACTAANNTIVSIGTFSEYFDLIVLAIVISIIIGLLLVVFTLKTRQQ